MTIAEPRFRVGQTVQLNPKTTFAGYQTGIVGRVSEITQEGRTRYQYEVVSREKTYANCPEEHLEPMFATTCIL